MARCREAFYDQTRISRFVRLACRVEATPCRPVETCFARSPPPFERIDTHFHIWREAPALVAALKAARWRGLNIVVSGASGDEPQNLEERLDTARQIYRSSGGAVTRASAFDGRTFENEGFAEREGRTAQQRELEGEADAARLDVPGDCPGDRGQRREQDRPLADITREARADCKIGDDRERGQERHEDPLARPGLSVCAASFGRRPRFRNPPPAPPDRTWPDLGSHSIGPRLSSYS
jgi:hypothetical protein